MVIDQLKVGKIIGIFVNPSNGVLDYAFELKSQIADIKSQNEFLILTPMFRGKPISLRMGDNLLVTFAYGEDGLLVFEAESRELIIDINGMSSYRIVGLTEARKLQRREHFRMTLQVPIVYQVIKNDRHMYGQGLARDISGGGVRFACGDQLEVGDFLSIFIRIDPGIDIRTQVQVIRVQSEGQKRYEVSSLFSFDFKEREELIKYIFNTQREKLKRKLRFSPSRLC